MKEGTINLYCSEVLKYFGNRLLTGRQKLVDAVHFVLVVRNELYQVIIVSPYENILIMIKIFVYVSKEILLVPQYCEL